MHEENIRERFADIHNQLPLPHPHLRLLPSPFPLAPHWVLAYTYTVSMAEAGKMYKAGVLMKNKYKHAKKEADAAAAAARATAALPPRVTAADPDNVRGKRTHRAICLDVRERLLMGPGPDSQTAVMASTSPHHHHHHLCYHLTACPARILVPRVHTLLLLTCKFLWVSLHVVRLLSVSVAG